MITSTAKNDHNNWESMESNSLIYVGTSKCAQGVTVMNKKDVFCSTATIISNDNITVVEWKDQLFHIRR